jgi:lysophospholipase L1-like esterase
MRTALGLAIVAGAIALFQGCSKAPLADTPDGGLAGPGVDPVVNDPGTTGDAGSHTSDGGLFTEPVGPPAVRYVGRFDTRDPAGPRVGEPGARVIVRFRGTSLTASLTEQSKYQGPSGYDVIVDGTMDPKPLFPTDGDKDYVLATGLAPGIHVVELWRRTEATVGITQFRAFVIGEGELLAPPPPRPHKIEFVGDSLTAGYGLECANANQTFTGATENEHKSYSALVANAIGADHSNFSFSGKGVSRNYDDGDDETMASLYPRTLADDPTSVWTFETWVPDVILVSLGTNDYTDTGGRPAPNPATFKAKYHELIALIRARNPSAHIVCAVSSTFSDDYPSGYNAFTTVKTTLQAVVDERHAAPINDPNVHYYEMPRTDSSGVDGAPDVTACDGHPNAAFDAKLAPDVTTKIKSIMGW